MEEVEAAAVAAVEGVAAAAFPPADQAAALLDVQAEAFLQGVQAAADRREALRAAADRLAEDIRDRRGSRYRQDHQDRQEDHGCSAGLTGEVLAAVR